MKTGLKTQIQVRIDVETKEKAKKILNDIGMDASTAVNILFKQIIRSGTFPIDLRDINGFTPQKALELEDSERSARQSKKSFKNSEDLIKDLLS